MRRKMRKRMKRILLWTIFLAAVVGVAAIAYADDGIFAVHERDGTTVAHYYKDGGLVGEAYQDKNGDWRLKATNKVVYRSAIQSVPGGRVLLDPATGREIGRIWRVKEKEPVLPKGTPVGGGGGG